jgi:hypothetical protein
MMKKIIVIIAALVLINIFVHINKKQLIEQPEGPISMDELDLLADKTTVLVQKEVIPPLGPQLSPQANTEPLPQPQITPEGGFKPTNQQIQMALAGAGFYQGKIDGKVGAQTKKAIQDFQKAKGLKIDGKVGAKTWGVLSKYLP